LNAKKVVLTAADSVVCSAATVVMQQVAAMGGHSIVHSAEGMVEKTIARKPARAGWR
jgi:hypothetical protein